MLSMKLMIFVKANLDIEARLATTSTECYLGVTVTFSSGPRFGPYASGCGAGTP